MDENTLWNRKAANQPKLLALNEKSRARQKRRCKARSLHIPIKATQG
jgi:hypothetical protein